MCALETHPLSLQLPVDFLFFSDGILLSKSDRLVFEAPKTTCETSGGATWKA